MDVKVRYRCHLHCKNWGVKMTPVGVNRGPHPQVLKLHPIEFEHNTKEC